MSCDKFQAIFVIVGVASRPCMSRDVLVENDNCPYVAKYMFKYLVIHVQLSIPWFSDVPC